MLIKSLNWWIIDVELIVTVGETGRNGQSQCGRTVDDDVLVAVSQRQTAAQRPAATQSQPQQVAHLHLICIPNDRPSSPTGLDISVSKLIDHLIKLIDHLCFFFFSFSFSDQHHPGTATEARVSYTKKKNIFFPKFHKFCMNSFSMKSAAVYLFFSLSFCVEFLRWINFSS